MNEKNEFFISKRNSNFESVLTPQGSQKFYNQLCTFKEHCKDFQ